MEDLSVIVRRKFCGLFKKKTEGFGTVEERIGKMNENRKLNRHDEIFEKRRIPLDMSPASPAPKRAKTPHQKRQKPALEPQPAPQPVNKRLEMLAKWKADKEKQRAEQKKKVKPIFKVSHVAASVGLPNLENVNLEIKGKPFKSKFAPPNHQFKPPANIKPINMMSEGTKTKKEKSETTATRHTMVTRSQSRAPPKVPETGQKNKNQVKGKKPKKTEQIKEKSTNVNTITEVHDEKTKTIDSSFMSPDYPLQKGTTSSESDDVKTPIKTNEPPVYVSPFVTVTRGKDSARKEFEARRVKKSFSEKVDTCVSPKAGAAYFRWALNREIVRLEETCQQWTKYIEDENPPEDAISMINVALGQTNLLLTKKFIQFLGLIEKCEGDDTLVTCEDLHGFWDMIHLQVDNLDKRFENLSNLKCNNWEEIKPPPKKDIKKKTKPIKNAKASSALREAIQAARRKKLENTESEVHLEVEVVQKMPRDKRNSNRLSVVKTDKPSRNSSPGLTMMKVATYAKNFETPGKSILKNSNSRSVRSHSKSVLFEDDIKDVEDLENDLNNLNLEMPSKTPTRRSARLSKNKLF